jgi:hypothetical protein
VLSILRRSVTTVPLVPHRSSFNVSTRAQKSVFQSSKQTGAASYLPLSNSLGSLKSFQGMHRCNGSLTDTCVCPSIADKSNPNCFGPVNWGSYVDFLRAGVQYTALPREASSLGPRGRSPCQRALPVIGTLPSCGITGGMFRGSPKSIHSSCSMYHCTHILSGISVHFKALLLLCSSALRSLGASMNSRAISEEQGPAEQAVVKFNQKAYGSWTEHREACEAACPAN